ncbi:hypothetical protein V8E53_009818 [Lactarius tabidus]
MPQPRPASGGSALGGGDGGINIIPDPQDASFLTNPVNHGADIAHLPPGNRGRPSFTSLIGSIDANAMQWRPLRREELSSIPPDYARIPFAYLSLHTQTPPQAGQELFTPALDVVSTAPNQAARARLVTGFQRSIPRKARFLPNTITA